LDDLAAPKAALGGNCSRFLLTQPETTTFHDQAWTRHGDRSFDFGKPGADDHGLKHFVLRRGTDQRPLRTPFSGHVPSPHDGLPTGRRRALCRAVT
jgi:hypothetical protein